MVEYGQMLRLVQKFLARVLALVGKPFYFILTRLIIGLLFIFYLLGHTILFLGHAILAIPRIKLPKVRLPRAKLPRLRFRLKTKAVIVVLSLFSILLFFYITILRGLPSPKELTTRNIEVSTKIYDRNGVLLYKIYKDKNRTLIPLSKVPLYVQQATLAAEDAEFYFHPGFSVRGIARSLLRNLKKGELTGGSTITQQLVKNALLSPEKTMRRKLKELILAVRVEMTFSKEEILEMYLNETPYGGTAYGIEEASWEYFGKKTENLSLAEAALLAGLPKSPTKFSPFGQNRESAFSRQKEVLNLMKINKFINEEQEKAALSEKVEFNPNKKEIKAPHFVMYVRELLVDKYGEDLVEKGGLEVTTSLDISVQEMAQKVVKDEVDKLKNLHVGNGAALVINPQTGEILAMVGSKDYFDIAGDGNVNVTTRLRQPGSSIKVVNYAYALSNGYTLSSIIDDSPVVFRVPGQPPYSPVNYDGAFRGRLPLRSALAESRNIPAVKVLASYGVTKMIEQGQKMGITSWKDPSRYGLSLTLGGGEVKLLDLAKVYATVANRGNRPEIMPILEVKDYKGKIWEKASPQSQPVLDPRVAFLLIDILKDNNARTPAFGSNSYLVIPNHPEIAVKTGTSNNLKDNLAVGFSQKYLVAVWVGNNDASPMARVASGVTGASPIWNKIMRTLLADNGTVGWEVPEGMVQVPVCTLLGTLPCEGCPIRNEWFLKEKTPKEKCRFIPAPTPGPNGQIIEPAARTEVVF